MNELTISLDPHRKTPLYEQIYGFIREEIRGGRIRAGAVSYTHLFHFKILIYFAAGSLKELFRDTIRLNTSASSLESFASTQKNPFLTNWKLSYAFASFKDGSR